MTSFWHVDIMASSFGEKMAPKLVVFKFQGVPSKSRFQDDYAKIKEIDLGHTNLGEFMRICNKPTKRSTLVFSLIRLGLVNVASHLVNISVILRINHDIGSTLFS